MSTKEQRLAREAAEILRSLEEDLEAARIPGDRPDADTHEDRLRALEAAMSAMLHALADSQ